MKIRLRKKSFTIVISRFNLGLILLSSLFLGASCSGYSDFNEKIKKDIIEHEALYVDLIESINKTTPKNIYGKFISHDKIPDSIKDKIESTIIGKNFNYLVVSKIKNYPGNQVEFIIGKWHLEFCKCPDSNFPRPNSYKKEGLIETWGITENWCVWTENDFI